MTSPVSGWQRDPTARHEYRYWDGSRWTDDVSDRGMTSTDPMGPMPAPGAMPPPGAGPDPTQVIDPTQSYPMAPAAPTQSYGQPGAGYRQDAAPGFGPYGTLPNDQPGSYGSYGSGGIPPVPTPKPDSGAKTGLFVGIGVLILAVLGVGAFLLTKDDDKNADETSTLPLSDQTDPGSDTTDTPPTTADPGDSGDSGDSGDVGSLGDLENVDPSDITEEMVVPLLTEELVNSGGLTEDQATCVSEALFDQVSIEELVQIGESGDVMGTLSSDQISALAESISDCGVG
ncbi:MAG TPA: DUF2510 domain-containing protein [Acidimicrobiales bacterium]|jgi:hypothetical protein